ncbi:hypothetical protein GCM10012286_09850 [Streptomyces lasiicapitis]|uniref:Uncharacterized protein n=1 Tax=Streptomyces lasiicapitis TaxID=1923961 RepID=A0ABQ2LJM6_9ACTN|nr:hypothetical protein GCM10012286_09850 [Streptomyces lasiicapitis]
MTVDNACSLNSDCWTTGVCTTGVGHLNRRRKRKIRAREYPSGASDLCHRDTREPRPVPEHRRPGDPRKDRYGHLDEAPGVG